MTVPLSPDEGVRAAADLHDLITHRAAWRNALVIAKEHAEASPPDVDDKGYWQHEIDVFDRTFAALSTPVPVIPMGTGDADEAYEIGKRDGYEKAVQDIDCLTGGDGEYTCVLGSDIDGRHCPDADSMKARIVERFEGLPRVSASAAEPFWRPMESAPKTAKEVILRIPARGWPDHYQQIAHWAEDMSGEEQPPFRGWFRNTGYGYAEVENPTGWRPLSAEAGADAASALPSPLPSQGEPVAWPEPIGFLKPEAGWTEEPRFVYAKHRTAAWMRAVFTEPVFSAEALAAERARADSLKREMEEWKAEAASHMRSAASLIEERAAAEARADRAEEDERDRLFEHTMSSNKTKVFDWLRQQGAMLPADRAALRARTTLKEKPHDA